ncbi:hypothetical protein NQ318_014580 [Aromia moschata]|uniref:Superoxide dismutase copper/zinc binding domain-containing protein n=1 Tax=Aromia moschata TaxID=1265417 RepID=A0AAV8XZS1_9CUCU|nr:hypothetical protein NQ318_014580 [Aromia moschata]
MFFILTGLNSVTPIELRSYVSEYGLHGTITFADTQDGIKITTDLKTTLEYPSQIWAWYVTEFPVDYTELENRCDSGKIGKTIVNLEDTFGYLLLPENQTAQYTTKDLSINGPLGLYGKSLLFRNMDTRRQICASITMVEKEQEKSAVARFSSPVAGSIYFRWYATKDNHSDVLITTNLYHVRNKENFDKSSEFTEHKWKIYVTDILESDNDRHIDNCDVLQLVFDPDDKGEEKGIGDIDARLGKIKVSTDYHRQKFKNLYRDNVLTLLPSDLGGPQRRLYVVLFESKHPDVFLGCAKIIYDHPMYTSLGGIKGDIRMTQNTRFEPTFLNFNLTTARGDLETRIVYSSTVAGYKIHELPIKPARSVGQNENSCLTTKFVYNPLKMDINSSPPNGFGTQDQYAVGDLSGKLLGRNNATVLVQGGQELNDTYWDIFLPLIGRYSIVHRSLVIYKNTQYPTSEIIAEPWICGGVTLYEKDFQSQKPVFTAQVLFRYPTVGRLLMRQAKDEPWADTSIMIEYLVHADGAALNNSADHRWAIHESPPGKDFYSWKERCLSAGNIFNPYKIDIDNTSSKEQCNMDNIGLCRVGDLSTRHGTLEISGKIVDSDRISRKLWTDPLLPLTGHRNVLGKSFLLYDDHGPKARGERLACSIIGGVYRRKAVAKDWFPNGSELSVKGKIEFIQQTEYDVTDIEVALEGLVETSGYHIHMTPVEENLQFPCEDTSLYGHWNPLNVDPSSSPRSYQGTPDQYEMGDLSGKFGSLDGHTAYKAGYNDTLLTLFGPRSILERSVVIHKKGTLYTNLRNLGSQFPNRYSSIFEQNSLNLRHNFVGDRRPSASFFIVDVCASFGELSTPFADMLNADTACKNRITARISHLAVTAIRDSIVDGCQAGTESRSDFYQGGIWSRGTSAHGGDTHRWACSTIERGYSPSEARELRAIASFHNPNGHAYGYLKMRQLIHTDGSASDTTIEVKLRHPGKHDHNVTRDHNWAIYVNPVGVDATVKTLATRCVAGGYIWNPYFTQLADPLNEDLYRQECGPENPLRCHVGDLSARLGTIDIGVKRKVFTDSNFPLEGDVTAIGRSIVILTPNRGGDRFACANIEPDYDIIKYANIEKPPRFVVAQFIEDVSAVMGIPEWFLTVDSRKTKNLHNNACVQLLLHFKGPIAGKLEQDFSRLLSIGKLEAPSLYIPGYINEKRKSKISYKQCGVRDPNEKSKYIHT